MIRALFNWRTGLALIAILIISGTIIYSQFLARKIALDERQKVEEWVEAGKLFLNDRSGLSDRLVSIITLNNKTIPIIQTDEKGNIIDHVNIDTNKIKQDPDYIRDRLEEFRSSNPPIEWIHPYDSTQRNYYYFGNSRLLKQVEYYPLVQLLVVALFIAVTIVALNINYRSSQNQVWAGMAKETAHQLGTPLTSLQGWIEMLKESGQQERIVSEIEKDIVRLKLVSDRFGKIGSKPKLEECDVVQQVNQMVEYMRKRAPGKVSMNLLHQVEPMIALISPPLFDWVIENLLKNALDAMEGKGSINVEIQRQGNKILVDVSDTGKGISRQHFTKVFKPGFTTKKRGWGLGLSLSKRIIEQFHEGQLFIKNSEPGKGTTFRIVLNS